MFRPDRIGTPVIHQTSVAISTIAWTPNVYAPPNYQGINCINATPVGDFGESSLQWSGSVAVAAAVNAFGIGQQFTITEPISGDTVGVELNGSIVISQPGSSTLIPFFIKLASPPATVLGATTAAELPTFFGPRETSLLNVATVVRRQNAYQEQLVYKGTPGAIAGTYCHGFFMINNTATAYNITDMLANFSVRQLNDQQNVSYRDTLR